jgi:glutamate 5-kinase
MARTKVNKQRQLWVIKAGSQTILSGGPMLIRSWMQQVWELRKNHIDVVWVTSGAIAAAAARTQFNKPKKTIAEKQALSAIGQPMMMDLYNLALQSQGLQGSQILLTYDDLAHEQRRKNFIATIQQLLKWKTVPIINENDVVATDEIKFGDNDALSALVAQAIGADRLVILTDVAGLYDRDPRVHSNAKMIAVVPRITDTQLKQPKESHTRQSNRPSSQSVGTGGMYSKLLAAQRASEAGIETWLVKGDRQHILPSLCQAQRRDMKLGTCIEGRT